MPKLDACPEIVTMARDLKLDHRRPVEAIVEYCKSRIARWVRAAGGADNLNEVEGIVCQNLGLTMLQVWTDGEIDGVADKYVKLGERVFASLSMQLTEETFATVMQREHAPAGAVDRFVAVVDCRGPKALRRFFTRWHEIAHILTLVSQHQLPFRAFRSTVPGDPMERLMDHIAGEVGFHDPIFQPALAAEIRIACRLTFDAVERVRVAVCPDASFQATLIACTRRMPTPVIQIEAAMRYKKAEENELASRQFSMFPGSVPEAKLRAYLSVPNSAAKERGFLIHPNMQVPERSVVSRHFHDAAGVDTSVAVSAVEEFSDWRCSNGTVCGQGKIHVEVKRVAGALAAVLQPVA